MHSEKKEEKQISIMKIVMVSYLVLRKVLHFATQ
jgi:hypothetical protein